MRARATHISVSYLSQARTQARALSVVGSAAGALWGARGGCVHITRAHLASVVRAFAYLIGARARDLIIIIIRPRVRVRANIVGGGARARVDVVASLNRCVRDGLTCAFSRRRRRRRTSSSARQKAAQLVAATTTTTVLASCVRY